MPSHNITSITLPTFNTVLARYPAAVPDSLRALDTQRYITVPAAVAARVDAHLSKEEVVKLVEWKLKHGTFRPQLLALVQSNTADNVQATTKSAFGLLPAVPAALKCLTALKGIGPATASLLLSVARPEEVPFFSDEVFRWCVWDDVGSPGGWKRKIKYSVKEYEEVLKGVEELRKRLGVKAAGVERVGWVLGREGVDCGEEDGGRVGVEEEGEDGGEEESEEVEKPVKKATANGTKRKTLATKAVPAEGTRKSARTKR